MNDGEGEDPIDLQRRLDCGGEPEHQVGRRDDVPSDRLRVFDPGEQPPRAGEPVEGEEGGQGRECVQLGVFEWCWGALDPILLVEDSIPVSASVSRALLTIHSDHAGPP